MNCFRKMKRLKSLCHPVQKIACFLVLLATCSLAWCQESEVPKPDLKELLAKTDTAARNRDYEAALSAISEALPMADEVTAARLRVRDGIYRKYLETPELFGLKRDNPDLLFGIIQTRSGQVLKGRIQLFELGITQLAGLGNRRPGAGGFALHVEGKDAPVNIASGDIAAVNVEWLEPVKDGWPTFWHLGKISITTHVGDIITGTCTWVLPISSIAIRPEDTDEDTLLNLMPVLNDTLKPEELAASLLIIGTPAPPEETPEIAPPSVTTTTETDTVAVETERIEE